MEDGQVLVHILLLVSILFQDYQYPWLSRDSKPVHNIPDEAERTSYIRHSSIQDFLIKKFSVYSPIEPWHKITTRV